MSLSAAPVEHDNLNIGLYVIISVINVMNGRTENNYGSYVIFTTAFCQPGAFSIM